MDEISRLHELYDHQILDTKPEDKFDELTQLASLICNTPISLVSLIDKDRQWFKSNYGMELKETLRKDGFCHYLLDGETDFFEIENANEDQRFVNSPLVEGYPYISFYAGAPIKSSTGHVLGALCVIDQKPNLLSENQRKALQILARKATEYLNTRKTFIYQQRHIEHNATRLKQILDNSPGVIFQLRVQENFEISFDFLSKGLKEVHPELSHQKIIEKPKSFLKYIHPDDINEFRLTFRNSALKMTPYKHKFRIIPVNGVTKWFKVRVTPKSINKNTVVWFGTLMDVSSIMEYETILEQITYDISHVIRKPLTTLLGLNNTLHDHSKLSEEELREYAKMINIVIEELDIFTRKLDQFYQLKIADHHSKI